MQPIRSVFSLWLEEHAIHFLIAGGLCVLGLAGALYFFGVLSERVAGIALAAALVLGLCGVACWSLWDASETPLFLILSTVLVLIAAGCAGFPIVRTLLPGKPLARGRLNLAGDSLDLPTGTRGRLRLLVHGTVAGAGAGRAEVFLTLGNKLVTAEIQRESRRVRVGRRGQGQLMEDHHSQFVSTTIPETVTRIRLDHVRGTLRAGVELKVFSGLIPTWAWAVIDSLLLLCAALLAARMGAGGFATGALACAVTFGFAVSRVATPEAALRPEIGALIVGVLVGAIVGPGLTNLFARLFAPQRSDAHVRLGQPTQSS